MELFSLVGRIMVDNDQANKSIAKTGEESDSLSGKMMNGLKTAAKWGAALGAAAIAVGAAAMKAADKFADTADTIDKASIRMGVDAEYYQELEYAMSQAGVEMSTLEKAAKKLEGTGLNIDDAIDQITSLGTEAERTKKAEELFGKSLAYQLKPALKQSGDELKATMQKAKDMGMVMSNDGVKNGVKYKDSMDTLKRSLAGLGTSIMSDLMPYLIKIIEWVTYKGIPAAQTVMSKIKEVVAVIKPYILSMWDTMKGVFSNISNAVNNFKAKFGEIVTKVNEVKNNIKDKIDAIKSFFDLSRLKMNWPKITLPHFKITGSMNPLKWAETGTPKISVDWHAKAMDEGMILNQPTIFGMQGNRLLGAGEVGSETVVGTDSLMKMIQKATAPSANNYTNNITINVSGAQNPQDVADEVMRKIQTAVNKKQLAWR